MEWISVEDRLPNYGDVVLIFETGYWAMGANVARFVRDEVRDNNKRPYSWYAPQGPMHWLGQDVSHWMPLPEPPDGMRYCYNIKIN